MEVLKMKLASYDYKTLDIWTKRLVETAKYDKVVVRGPIPLPTKRSIVTVLTSPHKHKDAREQFERRTHVRLIQFVSPTRNFLISLNKLVMPSIIQVTQSQK